MVRGATKIMLQFVLNVSGVTNMLPEMECPGSSGWMSDRGIRLLSMKWGMGPGVVVATLSLVVGFLWGELF